MTGLEKSPHQVVQEIGYQRMQWPVDQTPNAGERGSNGRRRHVESEPGVLGRLSVSRCSSGLRLSVQQAQIQVRINTERKNGSYANETPPCDPADVLGVVRADRYVHRVCINFRSLQHALPGVLDSTNSRCRSELDGGRSEYCLLRANSPRRRLHLSHSANRWRASVCFPDRFPKPDTRQL